MGVLTRTAKEVVRHLLHRAGADRMIDRLRKVRGIPTEYMNVSASERFEHIYDRRVWARWGPRAPGSGTGSSAEITRTVQSQLPVVLKEIECKTLLDIGCGDFTWMKHVQIDSRYIGIDIVPKIILQNSRLYEDARREFHLLDATRDALPDGDVVMCREVLFHLSFEDIFSMLNNVFAKERRYFIATTDRETLFNADIRSGDFRILNLQRMPFRFPEPEKVINDDSLVAGRRLGIWSADQLKGAGLQISAQEWSRGSKGRKRE